METNDTLMIPVGESLIATVKQQNTPNRKWNINSKLVSQGVSNIIQPTLHMQQENK